MRRWCGAVVVVGVALAALAGVAGCDGRAAVAPDPPGPLPSGVAPEAVTRWAQFPADRTPRPVVLLDELPLSSGYLTIVSVGNGWPPMSHCERCAQPESG
ncbi:hypothetical protein ABT297_37945 [Dactylosporangium sp. NPDC000555]|uniref:hypothetical protein n=1 Tax=Dactylosporangium sp. NPDC000555 TaxID=3154260 RepID=UPI003327F77E